MRFLNRLFFLVLFLCLFMFSLNSSIEASNNEVFNLDTFNNMTGINAISNQDGEIFLTGRSVEIIQNNGLGSNVLPKQWHSNMCWSLDKPENIFQFRSYSGCANPAIPGPNGKPTLVNFDGKVVFYAPDSQYSNSAGSYCSFDKSSYNMTALSRTEPRAYDPRNITVYAYQDKLISVAVYDKANYYYNLVFGMYKPGFGKNGVNEYCYKSVSFREQGGVTSLKWTCCLTPL